mmetsp:Transcript_11180/g.23161  ORF Transcript_11180/g.23161 Transcript_11180/m.23161 type:complete len:342 (-) Transcript_11180:638-1663(-)
MLCGFLGLVLRGLFLLVKLGLVLLLELFGVHVRDFFGGHGVRVVSHRREELLLLGVLHLLLNLLYLFLLAKDLLSLDSLLFLHLACGLLRSSLLLFETNLFLGLSLHFLLSALDLGLALDQRSVFGVTDFADALVDCDTRRDLGGNVLRSKGCAHGFQLLTQDGQLGSHGIGFHLDISESQASGSVVDANRESLVCLCKEDNGLFDVLKGHSQSVGEILEKLDLDGVVRRTQIPQQLEQQNTLEWLDVSAQYNNALGIGLQSFDLFQEGFTAFHQNKRIGTLFQQKVELLEVVWDLFENALAVDLFQEGRSGGVAGGKSQQSCHASHLFLHARFTESSFAG